MNEAHINQYLRKGVRTNTLTEIYMNSMKNKDKKNQWLETIPYTYLKGRIPRREYVDAIYLQIGEADENPQVQNMDPVHFDEIREVIQNEKGMQKISYYDNDRVLHYLSIYCNKVNTVE